jgi:hypothetical protein
MASSNDISFSVFGSVNPDWIGHISKLYSDEFLRYVLRFSISLATDKALPLYSGHLSSIIYFWTASF